MKIAYDSIKNALIPSTPVRNGGKVIPQGTIKFNGLIAKRVKVTYYKPKTIISWDKSKQDSPNKNITSAISTALIGKGISKYGTTGNFYSGIAIELHSLWYDSMVDEDVNLGKIIILCLKQAQMIKII